MEIWYLIDKLEELIKKGRRLPLASGTLVDQEEALSIIREIRSSLPREIREAQRLSQEAEQILAQAREKAQALLDDTELLQSAQEERNRILEEARRQAEELRRDADEYAMQVLGQLEDQLAAVQNTLRNGLEYIQRKHRDQKPKGKS